MPKESNSEKLSKKFCHPGNSSVLGYSIESLWEIRAGLSVNARLFLCGHWNMYINTVALDLERTYKILFDFLLIAEV